MDAEAAYFAVSDRYNDWAKRWAAEPNSLTSKERAGFLVIDLWIRTAMRSFDGFLDDHTLSAETVMALRAVGLPRQADVVAALLRASPPPGKDRSGWFAEQLEGAEHPISSEDDATFHSAVCRYLETNPI